MPGLNGIELMKWTKASLEGKEVPPENMPKFAFRAQPFWELSSDIIREIFDLGVKSEDVIEKITKKNDIQKYFKRIGYYYLQLADNK